MKQFKNKIAVTGTVALRRAFRDELLAIGYKWAAIDTDDFRDNNYLVNYWNNKPGLANYPDNLYKIYNLPQQWDEALKAASEIIEEIPEYVEAVMDLTGIKKGKIYSMRGYTIIDGKFDNYTYNLSEENRYFKSSTKEAYDEQNKPKIGDYICIISTGSTISNFSTSAEPKPYGAGVGDVVKITGITPTGGNATIADPRYYGNNFNLRAEGFRLATPEEIAEVIKPKFELGKWYKSNPEGSHYIKYEYTKPSGSEWNWIYGTESFTDRTKSHKIEKCTWANTDFERYALATGDVTKEVEKLIELHKLPIYKTLILGTSNIKITVSKGLIEAGGHKSSLTQLLTIDRALNPSWKIAGWDISFPSIKIGCSVFTQDEIKQIIDLYKELND